MYATVFNPGDTTDDRATICMCSQIGANDGSVNTISSDIKSEGTESGTPAQRLLGTSDLFAHEIIHTRAYGRVGLCGNPSDGYGGKTLSVTVCV